MDDKVAELLARVGDFGAKAGRGDFADVADLAAGLAVERRLVEDQRSALARIERLDLDAVLDDRADDALGGLGLVTEKLGRADALAQAVPDRFGRSFARARPGPARLGALALHGGVEAVRVDRKPAGAQGVLRQIEREAIGVVEPERRLAVQHAAVAKRARLVLENGEAPRQRRAKARLLELRASPRSATRRGSARDRPGPSRASAPERAATSRDRARRESARGAWRGA